MDTWRNLPLRLRELPQWLCWRWDTRPSGRTKVPLHAATLGAAKSNNPYTWTRFALALRSVQAGDVDGLGFGFAPGGGLVGVDLDGCIDADGCLSPFAGQVVDALSSYTEITPSGQGLHIICAGTLPGERRQRKAPGANIELYPDGRFFTMTGRPWPGTPPTVEARTDALAALYGDLFPTREPVALPVAIPGPRLLSDTDILAIASRARNGAKFARLLRGDTTGYPSASEADAALLSILAFYTQDPAQLERLFCLSALSDGKWHRRPDYRARTIGLALRNVSARFGEVAA